MCWVTTTAMGAPTAASLSLRGRSDRGSTVNLHTPVTVTVMPALVHDPLTASTVTSRGGTASFARPLNVGGVGSGRALPIRPGDQPPPHDATPRMTITTTSTSRGRGTFTGEGPLYRPPVFRQRAHARPPSAGGAIARIAAMSRLMKPAIPP